MGLGEITVVTAKIVVECPCDTPRYLQTAADEIGRFTIGMADVRNAFWRDGKLIAEIPLNQEFFGALLDQDVKRHTYPDGI